MPEKVVLQIENLGKPVEFAVDQFPGELRLHQSFLFKGSMYIVTLDYISKGEDGTDFRGINATEANSDKGNLYKEVRESLVQHGLIQSEYTLFSIDDSVE